MRPESEGLRRNGEEEVLAVGEVPQGRGRRLAVGAEEQMKRGCTAAGESEEDGGRKNIIPAGRIHSADLMNSMVTRINSNVCWKIAK